MKNPRFTKMLGFELRDVIYGDPMDSTKPFIDLRRQQNGTYTINAIHHLHEIEINIGKRWYRKKLPLYIASGLIRLNESINRGIEDKVYLESIRVKQGIYEL